MEGGNHMSASGPTRRKRRGGRDDWQTPRPLFELIDRAVGGFTLDAAASEANRLCERWLEGPCTGKGIKLDGSHCICGLCADWLEHKAFCNPPYGTTGPGLWIAKFADAAAKGALVVGYLSSAGMDTGWFAQAYATCYSIVPLSGRVEHSVDDGKRGSGNTGGNMLITWRPGLERPAPVDGKVRPLFELWDWQADIDAERARASGLLEAVTVD